MTIEKLDTMILNRIRDYPGAKLADIFDLDVKEACSRVSMAPVANLFRVCDRRLQFLRREGIIEYKGGWRLTKKRKTKP